MWDETELREREEENWRTGKDKKKSTNVEMFEVENGKVQEVLPTELV